MAAKRDVPAWENRDFEVPISFWLDRAKTTPRDMSGFQFACVAREYRDEAAPLVVEFEFDLSVAAVGTIVWLADAALMKGLLVRNPYDIKVTRPDDLTVTWFWGDLVRMTPVTP